MSRIIRDPFTYNLPHLDIHGETSTTCVAPINSFIKDNIHLSGLQDKYHQRLTEKGFDLERGIKGSDNVNINIKELKKITRKLNIDLNNKTQRLSNSVKDLQDKMKSNKNVLFDKEYVKIKKDTFDTMIRL